MTNYQVTLAETQIQISGRLSDLFPGESRLFTITVLNADGDPVDISGDAMTLRIKTRKTDLDADALLSKDASSLVSNEASFSLTTSDTDLTPGSYYSDIEWVTAAGLIFVVYDAPVRVLERVSDA